MTSKRKLWVLTQGRFSNYGIYGWVEGPADADLTALLTEFRQGCHWPKDTDRVYIYSTPEPEELKLLAALGKSLDADYFDEMNVADEFHDWLIREKGFTKQPVWEFCIDGEDVDIRKPGEKRLG